MSSTASTRRVALWSAELGLLALALGTAAGLNRLFIGWGFLVDLAAPATIAWGIALVLRRRRVPVGPALAVHLVVGIVLLSWWFAAGTQLFAVIPTPTTVQQLWDDVSSSFTQFAALVAPVEPTTGFLVAVAAALWVFAFFGDTAAFRFRGPIQAAVPYGAAFAAVGVLARDSGRTVAAICFLVGLGIYAVTQRGLGSSEDRWVSGDAGRGVRSVVLSASSVVVVALFAGLVIGPLLPAGDEPVVDLRKLGQGSGPRTVISPFVSIRSMLGERSDQVMFDVAAPSASYWRLTALERFDAERDIWTSRGSYQEADGQLAAPFSPDVPTTELPQQYRLQGLTSDWLPGAYAPSQVEGDAAMTFDPESSSLMDSSDDRSAGDEYSLMSRVPNFSESAGSGGADDDLAAVYLETPGIDDADRQTLDQVVAGADGSMQQLLALQNWFRDEFTYDEDVDFSTAPDALAAFLDQRRGFCQQFSSAFALMARELGLPSRVAVGFTQGDQIESADGDVAFVVRGRHAHAWPEVHLAGVGWVPFEPTPQRGNPQDQGHTGVPPAQATPPPEQAATTTSTPAPTSTTPSTPTTANPQVDATEMPEVAEAEDDPSGPSPWIWVVAAIALLGVGTGAAMWVQRLRRRSTDSDAGREARVADAWSHAVRSLHPLGLRPEPSETPIEFAERVRLELDTDLLGDLARVETTRRFSRRGPDTDVVASAERAAEQIADHVRSITTRRERVGARVGR